MVGGPEVEIVYRIGDFSYLRGIFQVKLEDLSAQPILCLTTQTEAK